jgi:hypothetical protein
LNLNLDTGTTFELAKIDINFENQKAGKRLRIRLAEEFYFRKCSLIIKQA